MKRLRPTPAVKRLRPTPEALAARGIEIPPTPSWQELIEQTAAERDRALDLLDRLDAIIREIGGYMTSTDQATLRESRALLVEQGRRAPEHAGVWVNREGGSRPQCARCSAKPCICSRPQLKIIVQL